MEPKVIIALLIVVILVIGVNGALLLALKSGRKSRHIQLWQKAIRRARDPWQGENQDIAELSRLVSELQPSGENIQEQK